MTAIPTPFGSSAGRYAFSGTPGLVNCHAEISSRQGTSRFVIVPSDGLSAFATPTDTPNRGEFFLDDQNYILNVRSGGVWKVLQDGTATRLGTIPGQDRVRFARNNKATPQVVILCNAGLYVVEGTSVFKLITDTLPSGVVDITDQDGFIIVLIGDGRYFISALNEATSIEALDFSDAEQNPDKLRAGASFGGYLWLFGSKSIEIHRNTGNADFPFTPMPTTIPRGIASRDSLAFSDNTMMFVGDDGIVYRLNGFGSPVRISNHEVERAILGETDPSTIYGLSWSRGGHAFYVITGTSWTYCFDANTKEWNRRRSYGHDTWLINGAVMAWNKVIVGGSQNGSLYYLDETRYNEDGGVLNGLQVSEIVFPTLTLFPNGGIIDAIFLDYVTGQGATSPSSQGYDPSIMLDYSLDGGNSFQGERIIRTGKQGAYDTRLIARRLGKFESRGVVFRVRQSDLVGRALANVAVKMRPFKNPTKN